MSAPHPAIGLTSAVALAAAATIPGSLIHDLAPAQPTYRIGTLSGPIEVAITENPGGRAVAFRRNSRRIVDALVYIPVHQHPDRPRPTPSPAATPRPPSPDHACRPRPVIAPIPVPAEPSRWRRRVGEEDQ